SARRLERRAHGLAKERRHGDVGDDRGEAPGDVGRVELRTPDEVRADVDGVAALAERDGEGFVVHGALLEECCCSAPTMRPTSDEALWAPVSTVRWAASR